jgi:methyl-accepting chemotaxis protein
MRISFRLRLLAITALSLVLAIGVAVSVAGHANFQTRAEQSRDRSLQHALALAYELQAELTVGMDAARVLADGMRGYLAAVPAGKRDRQMWSAAVRAVLESHPQFSGVYITCEPGSFDGRDGEFAGKPGEEARGRFSPYWSRAADGKLAAEVTVGIEDATPGPTGVRTGEWYLRLRELKRECVIDPYFYEV